MLNLAPKLLLALACFVMIFQDYDIDQVNMERIELETETVYANLTEIQVQCTSPLIHKYKSFSPSDVKVQLGSHEHAQ